VHAANANHQTEELHAPARSWAGPTPGTKVSGGVDFLAFKLYSFTNWKLLSFLWKIG
jgi:hypothetical protein